MPCNSDYMEANSIEIEASRMFAILDEIEKGITVDSSSDGWDGYDRRAYGNRVSRAELDKLVAKACKTLQTADVSKFSLEVQMWWRDHQRADQMRLQRDLAAKRTEEDKAAALKKLTPYERKLLGIDSENEGG